MQQNQYRVAALALGIGCWTGSALAQNVNSGVGIGPSQGVAAPAASASTPEVEHLLGDWGGVRTSLGNLGIDFILDATAEFAGNVSGGTKQGATSANQIGAELDIDWQKLAGITGFSTHAVVVNRSGANDSALFGDNLQPVQEIYGSGGDVAVHLVYVYGEEKLLHGKLDIAAGWMPLANDFASSPLYCNFMNNGLCGNPKDLPGGDVGFSSYPDAVLGGRIRVAPTPDYYVQVGLYQVNQALYSYPAYRSGFAFDTSQVHGAEIPVEVGWNPHFGADALPGHYKLGAAVDTTSYKDLYRDVNGNALLATGQPARQHRDTTQFWALADQMLVRNGAADDAGITALAGYIHSDPDTATYGDEAFVGLLDKGFWKARPQDTVGLLFTYQTVSHGLTRTQALDQEFGIPYANGASGIQKHEEILEVNYDIHVFRGVNFEPDFQYVFRPNAQSNIHDAAVFGFKTHVTF